MESSEPGNRIRSMFSAGAGVTETFTSKVDDYVSARPSYPPQLFAFFSGTVGVKSGALVVDVGAGSGLFTAGLLEHGYRVLAVEPNEPMRLEADARFRDVPCYSSAAGSAEALPLADGSADFITAAQAFHWFDVERARAEFLRVLRPGAPVALVWNDRVLADPLHQALDEVFAEFGGERRSALVAHETQREVPAFFGGNLPAELRWPHEQRLTEVGLLSLAFSRSYMPDRGSERASAVEKAVTGVFRRFAEGATVAVRYTTIAFVGRPQG